MACMEFVSATRGNRKFSKTFSYCGNFSMKTPRKMRRKLSKTPKETKHFINVQNNCCLTINKSRVSRVL